MDGVAQADARFMALALALGRRGLGRTWPNPAVGCIIVSAGRIVGRGRTADGGRPHAEVVALTQAGMYARGATAYVTLEPCAHHGHTGPCADALVAAGVARVVIATVDPNPQVNGGGIARLRAAGIDVTVGLRGPEAQADNAGFLSNVLRGRPWVTLKLAMTLDGRIATRTGQSRWITGAAARTCVHAMRAAHDAVMVGGGTARADDPMLDVRGLGDVVQPVRVVLSRGLDLPPGGRLGRTAGAVPLWLVHAEAAAPATRAAWEATGARLVPAPADADGIRPDEALSALAALGLTRIFCEGGGALAASLLNAGVVDEIVAFAAGFPLGAEATPGVGAMGLDSLDAAPRFDLVEARRVGADVLTRWRAPLDWASAHPVAAP